MRFIRKSKCYKAVVSLLLVVLMGPFSGVAYAQAPHTSAWEEAMATFQHWVEQALAFAVQISKGGSNALRELIRVASYYIDNFQEKLTAMIAALQAFWGDAKTPEEMIQKSAQFMVNFLNQVWAYVLSFFNAVQIPPDDNTPTNTEITPGEPPPLPDFLNGVYQ